MRISDWSSDVCSSDLLVLSGSETYDRRKANSCVRTLDGKRLFRSIGRQADVVGGSYSYIDVPRLFSHKFVHEPGAPWYVPTELKRSEEHTSELQSLMRISSAVFCLKNKRKKTNEHT